MLHDADILNLHLIEPITEGAGGLQARSGHRVGAVMFRIQQSSELQIPSR
jgi:hypothetical protein